MHGVRLAPVVGVLICLATWFGAGPAVAAGSVTATATIDGRSIGGADASNPVRLEPSKVTLVVVEVKNETANAVSVRRVDLTGHVIGLNFFSYSTSVETQERGSSLWEAPIHSVLLLPQKDRESKRPEYLL